MTHPILSIISGRKKGRRDVKLTLAFNAEHNHHAETHSEEEHHQFHVKFDSEVGADVALPEVDAWEFAGYFSVVDRFLTQEAKKRPAVQVGDEQVPDFKFIQVDPAMLFSPTVDGERPSPEDVRARLFGAAGIDLPDTDK